MIYDGFTFFIIFFLFFIEDSKKQWDDQFVESTISLEIQIANRANDKVIYYQQFSVLIFQFLILVFEFLLPRSYFILFLDHFYFSFLFFFFFLMECELQTSVFTLNINVGSCAYISYLLGKFYEIINKIYKAVELK